ncbi:MAG: hypothetical protein H6578_07400 [Chitinophagales bacterium]|nr:hypothetical protein [Chitinophagales bacterium]
MRYKSSKVSSFFFVFLLLFQVAMFNVILSNSQYQMVNVVEEEIKEIVHFNEITVVKDLFCSINDIFVDVLSQHDTRVFYSSNYITTDTPPPEC